MTILAGKPFNGPYSDALDIAKKPGVYVVVCETRDKKIIEVGETEDVSAEIGSQHQRWEHWGKICGGEVHYWRGSTQVDRLELVRKVREELGLEP